MCKIEFNNIIAHKKEKEEMNIATVFSFHILSILMIVYRILDFMKEKIITDNKGIKWESI